ncbi:response regulator transcription factor [Streptomyces sp. NPDC000151]|uniref:response regulator transcription factor n=1 Tax=Streptomyces sp. NPDC000151 TaxID=3154244 RepID=UPI00332320CC
MTGADAPARVVIADDHTLFREGIVEICETESDLHVVGQAEHGEEAVALVRRRSPDVVLLDVEMPGPGAEETLEQVLNVPEPPRVAVLTMHDDARMVSRLLAIGAQAYISKSSTREELLAAIRAVRRDPDRVVLSVAKETVSRLERPAQGPLSARELEVLGLVARGLSNAQIAGELYISEGTVKRHLTNIYLKLEVRSRMNAINKAVAMRLLPAAEPGAAAR